MGTSSTDAVCCGSARGVQELAKKSHSADVLSEAETIAQRRPASYQELTETGNLRGHHPFCSFLAASSHAETARAPPRDPLGNTRRRPVRPAAFHHRDFVAAGVPADFIHEHADQHQSAAPALDQCRGGFRDVRHPRDVESMPVVSNHKASLFRRKDGAHMDPPLTTRRLGAAPLERVVRRCFGLHESRQLCGSEFQVPVIHCVLQCLDERFSQPDPIGLINDSRVDRGLLQLCHQGRDEQQVILEFKLQFLVS